MFFPTTGPALLFGRSRSDNGTRRKQKKTELEKVNRILGRHGRSTRRPFYFSSCLISYSRSGIRVIHLYHVRRCNTWMHSRIVCITELLDQRAMTDMAFRIICQISVTLTLTRPEVYAKRFVERSEIHAPEFPESQRWLTQLGRKTNVEIYWAYLNG